MAASLLVRRPLLVLLVCLFGALVLFFRWAFHPDYAVFSNDGPLGVNAAAYAAAPGCFRGMWVDLNWLGHNGGSVAPGLSGLTVWLLGPLGAAKFYAPLTLLYLGLCAWFFFRELRLGALAALLGGLATVFCSDYFGVSCWGVGAQALAFGCNFLALGIVVSPRPMAAWVRYPLAGLAVGMGVMEGFDVGAIFSLFSAAFVVFHALVADGEIVKRAAKGVSRVVVISVFAAFIAAAALASLIGTQVKGVVGMAQDAETKAQRWDTATQWSLPKREVLGIIVPGLFGFRMDTPEGGNYWGAVGRDPSWDRYFESGKQGQPHGTIRYGGGGNYAGVLVLVIAIWAAAQSLRKENSAFSITQRKFIWFWCGVMFVSLLLAFGRHAPFYQLFYALPYASTIRNPVKFLHVLQFALLTVFAYGVHGLSRRYLEAPAVATRDLVSQWQSWWAKASSFDKKWVAGSALALGASLIGWFGYASSRPKLMGYLQEVNFGPEMAKAIAGFSVGQVGWFILFLALSLALFAVVISGYFAGARARAGAILLGALMMVDLGRVDLRWLITYNWREMYETNTVMEFLRDHAYERRVTMFPLDRFIDLRKLPREAMPLAYAYNNLQGLYEGEWKQHLFQYYNIQCIDVVQEPRVASDKTAWEAVMAFNPMRRWELTNTKYFLAPTALASFLNQQIDPVKKRFRPVTQFDFAAKPGADSSGPRPEQITTVMNTNGQEAIFEFTGALPRAKLFSNWHVSTNEPAKLQQWLKDLQQKLPPDMASAVAGLDATDQATLKELADDAFDPEQTVLLANPLPVPASTNQNPGEVKFVSYSSKHIVLNANTKSPAVLLLDDRYDPNWKVTVDGKPAPLLRCDYIVRGVYLPTPGEHRVEFDFSLPMKAFYVSLAGIAVGLGLWGFVAFGPRKAVPASIAEPPTSKDLEKK